MKAKAIARRSDFAAVVAVEKMAREAIDLRQIVKRAERRRKRPLD